MAIDSDDPDSTQRPYSSPPSAFPPAVSTAPAGLSDRMTLLRVLEATRAGIVVLTDTGSVAFVNRVARALLPISTGDELATRYAPTVAARIRRWLSAQFEEQVATPGNPLFLPSSSHGMLVIEPTVCACPDGTLLIGTVRSPFDAQHMDVIRSMQRDFLEICESVANQRAYDTSLSPVDPERFGLLSEAEADVAKDLAMGLRAGEIAVRAECSVTEVNAQLRIICEKLGIRSLSVLRQYLAHRHWPS